jgi:ankyrin repeat protein
MPNQHSDEARAFCSVFGDAVQTRNVKIAQNLLQTHPELKDEATHILKSDYLCTPHENRSDVLAFAKLLNLDTGSLANNPYMQHDIWQKYKIYALQENCLSNDLLCESKKKKFFLNGWNSLPETTLSPATSDNLTQAQSTGLSCPNITLHQAAQEGNLDVGRKLIEGGADINERFYSKHTADWDNCWTPLHYAAYFGKKEFVHLLLENGADRQLYTACNNTAVMLAKQRGHREIVRLLTPISEQPRFRLEDIPKIDSSQPMLPIHKQYFPKKFAASAPPATQNYGSQRRSTKDSRPRSKPW